VTDEPTQTRPHRERLLNLPPMVTALILVSVGVHAVRWLLPTEVDDAVVSALAFVPLRYTVPEYFTWRSLLSPIGHQFLHASIGHLLMNMVFLAALPLPGSYRSRRRRIIVIGGIWLVLNVVVGYTGMAIGGGDDAPIAWVAHIGGFIAGVALIDLFVPKKKRVEPEQQP
jgi:membrane associated rhomboid family serine protease